MTLGFATTSDGARLYYEIAGDGPPVVLVHGGLWDRRMWDQQWEAFTERFRVMRFDARGFGRSDPLTGTFRDVDDVVAVTDATGFDHSALVGLSFGGYVSIDVVLARPERVTALVLVGAGVRGFDEWRPEIDARQEEAEALARAGDLATATDVYLDIFTPLRTGDDERQRRIAHENENAQSIENDELREAIEPRAIDRLGEIGVPKQVVWGDRDIEEIAAMGEILVAGIPGARRAVIEDADHVPNIRKPDLFNRVVLEFLEEALR
ncbi:MAG: alpha/beta fold hydrolase [Actinomycetota bacterium]